LSAGEKEDLFNGGLLLTPPHLKLNDFPETSVSDVRVLMDRQLQANSEGEADIASSKRKSQLKRAFGWSLALASASFTALLFGLTQYASFSSNLAGQVEQYYQFFVHVNIMVFVGFGFLMTFLRRYGYGAVALNMLASAVVFVEAILVLGVTMQVQLFSCPVSYCHVMHGAMCCPAWPTLTPVVALPT
jgi:cation transport ATPase